MTTLDRVKKNTCCRICRIDSQNQHTMHLFGLGICVGNYAEVIQNCCLVPILLRIGNSTIAVSRKWARGILVEEA
ncbi:MAG: ferrous iron transport protein A [Puniceicoccales bacterium]|nr:ferrous iron transport protein A [Puniceicoccales bacterium]